MSYGWYDDDDYSSKVPTNNVKNIDKLNKRTEKAN